MTNAELFKQVFGRYAEEFWAYPEEKMLDWLASDVPDTSVVDSISRKAAIEMFNDAKGSEEYHNEYEDGYNDGIDFAISTLSTLPPAQPAQRWISVSDWLPEDEKEVLVTRHFLSDNQLKKNAITESFYVEVASRMDDEWTSYSDEYKIRKHLHKVTAWMPLPEPYKEDEDNAKIH